MYRFLVLGFSHNYLIRASKFLIPIVSPTICQLTGHFYTYIYLHHKSRMLPGVGVAIAIAFVPVDVTPLADMIEGVACGVPCGVPWAVVRCLWFLRGQMSKNINTI